MREILDDLEENYRDKHKIYLVKSGVLQQLHLKSSDIAALCSKGQCLIDLKKCCKLMPNYYYPHWQQEMLHYDAQVNGPHPLGNLRQWEVLRKRFPNEVEILQSMMPFLLATGKAEHELKKFRRHNPDKIEQTWHAEGMIYPGGPRMVECFRRDINYRPYLWLPYLQLGNHFNHCTHEYGKELEVLNKFLDHAIIAKEFSDAFEIRQKLLSKIIEQNYWHKL